VPRNGAARLNTLPGDLHNLKNWLLTVVKLPDQATANGLHPEPHHCLQLATWAQRICPYLGTFVAAVHGQAEVTFDLTQGQVVGNLTRKVILSDMRLARANLLPPANPLLLDPPG
jgi:hypothetical protein